nr:MAG TPA: hypothetical protein [Caudoviricetes sp.]
MALESVRNVWNWCIIYYQAKYNFVLSAKTIVINVLR